MEELLPEALPPGTPLGSWQVHGRAGYGTYGAVYRAHRKGWRKGAPVALKLARFPEDLRFDREAELLARIQHPSVPQLLGRGTWTGSREGERHPFLVMQWVEGLPPLATDPSLVGDDGRDILAVMVPPGRLTPMASELENLILRMLSEKPQDRGSAAELAAALEKVSAGRGPRAMLPKRVRPLVALLSRGLALPMLAGCLAFGLLVLLSGHLNLEGVWAPPSVMGDAGTRGVADAAVEEAPMPSMAPSSEPGGLHLEMPKEPLPGQRRPPCPGYQTNIRGGCWVEGARGTPPCGEGAYDWKGACYYPVFVPPRPHTSDTP
ncbi:hypothetical protein [Stigmatella erecta]|uniref:Protein kinase domain-containing protein n=1 Tax=Stigmatella erecta TaxID=83460 RepID=A0A1I0AIX0_9BACT|nr:hypothetical protein [Stigmatella erecta]SES94286.1 hypothetical protein SAMN05443639_101706 [Stigmatella erecta]